ncbi:Ig-like domain repeat protein [Streptomyces sp. NPDC048639]|uniref:Ig-like domain repeat protein n=1 Tax=Streptomyces sp. NPDC048639 TaxID=3365581 RepID=UPI003717ADC7
MSGSPPLPHSEGRFVAFSITRVTSSPNPTVFGQTVTITAQVIPLGFGTPTGTVTFTIVGGPTLTGTLSGGSVTVTTNAITPGLRQITAQYNGDSNFNPSSGTTNQLVLKASTTTTVTSSPDPSNFSQTVTLTATVTPNAPSTATPTGTVTFVVSGGGGGTLTGTLAGGVATVTTSSLAPGAHNVIATYNGNANFNGSTGTDTHTVSKASSTTTVSSSPDPSTFGQTVTITATVAPVAPAVATPTGTVTFVISGGGGGTLTGTLIGGVATVTTSSLTAGAAHNITATYNGDVNYNGSSGTDTQTVNQASTTTTVTSSPDPSVFGQNVTFTATVAPVAPGAGTPTGTVTFVISGGPTLTGTLSGGVATVSTSALSVGPHTVTATYGGSSNFTGSSGTDTHTVGQASTTTTVISSPDPSVFGQPIAITATVTPNAPGSGTPTGTVTFVVDAGAPQTVALSGGSASITVSGLSVGSHNISATYSGDASFTGSSDTDTHTVNKASTTTAVTSSPDPSVSGQSVSFTATVTPTSPGAGVPTGNVTFVITNGVTTLTSTGALNGSGVATVTAPLSAGSWTVTATYTGDANFNGSTGTDSHTVGKASTTTTVTSSPDPSVSGQSVTFTAFVVPVAPGAGTPTGNVTFVITDGVTTVTLIDALDGSGAASASTSALGAGSWTVTATYAGDANFNGSSDTDTHTVGQASTTTVVTSAPDPSVSGQTVTLTATVTANAPGSGTPTGTVTFTVTGGPTLTGTLSGGVATVTTTGIPVGTSTITATYGGDANFTGSSGTDTHTVGQASTTTTVTSSPDPSVVGQTVTITATVAANPPGSGTPTGNVSFVIDGGAPQVVALSGGTASINTSSLAVGSHTITATYGGNANFTGSSGNDTQVVNLASTTTTVTSSPDPSVSGQSVTFTALVSPVPPGAGTPTGNVTFVITDGVTTVTLIDALDGSGIAAVSTPLNAGNYTVTATYAGDSNFGGSSDTDTHTVGQASTTTTVTSSPDPSVVGQTVTITATVAPGAPGAGTPTGIVSFVIDGGAPQTAPLVGGVATITTNTLAVGAHTISATYAGDGNFTGSTGSDTHTVGQASTTTTVASSPDPSVFGQTVTLTATVNPVAPGAGTPTGNVTFVIDGGAPQSVALVGNTATLTTSTLAVGPHTINATYSGDAGFTGSSGTDGHTVNQADSLTTVTSSPDPSVSGQAVTFTALVSPVAPGAGVPTGTVTFVITDGVTTVTLTDALDGSGFAAVSTPLDTGNYTVTASYAGDADFTASSDTDTHTVGQASTTTTVASSPDPSVFGQTVTLTATVNPVAPGAGTPTGNVTFVIDGGAPITVALVGNTATTSVSSLSVGSHSVSATYLGDTEFSGSTGSDTHTVGQASTTTTVASSPNPSLFGEPVTITATVNPVAPGAGTPTGNVNFVIDGGSPQPATLVGNTATITDASLSVGSHTITATYVGDTNFSSSSDTDTHVVNQAATQTTVVSSPEPSVFGETVTITATVAPVSPGAGTPTGNVTFVIGMASTQTAPLIGGVATITETGLAVGTYAVSATYAGDTNFTGSTGSDNHTVVPADTTTTVTSSPDPSEFGETVTITATVAPVAPGAGAPSGNVTFVIDAGTPQIVTLVGNTATLTTSSLSLGGHNISATYSGDGSFNGSSDTDTHTVNQGQTTTIVTSSPDPSEFGETVTITANVTANAPASGVPSGNVTFTIDAGAPQVVVLDGMGQASISTSSLSVGLHNITATYGGDVNFVGSTDTDTHTVDVSATTTTVVSAPDPSVLGGPVTITATVVPVAPGAGTPTGSVDFVIDGGSPTTVALTGNTATLTTSSLSLGSHSITAAYSGDGNFTGSTGSDTHTVGQAATTTSVAASPEPSVVGESVTITATVAVVPPGTGTPTGSVDFVIDGDTPITVPLVGNTATLTTDELTLGSHTISATYTGDISFTGSTGSTTHEVGQANTLTALDGDPNPSTFGELVTFTATVTVASPGAGTPTGSVDFSVDAGPATTVPLSGNTAVFTTDDIAPGNHSVTATYSGDADFASSGNGVAHVVNAAATTTLAVSAPDPSDNGDSVQLIAVVQAVAPGAGVPTGTVTFTLTGPTTETQTGTLDGDGVATATSGALSTGLYNITAVYGGDSNFTTSSDTDTQTVNA